MARTTTHVRLLILVLVPLFLMCMALHLREMRRTGLAQPPVFAAPTWSGDRYPVVGGLRLERGASWNELHPGDVLIRIGEIDLSGKGYLSFDAIALEQAGTELRTSVVYERDGILHEGQLQMLSYRRPWLRVPALFASAITALMVLMRSQGSVQSRRFFIAFMGLAILQTSFLGGSRIQSYAYLALFNGGAAFALWFMIRWFVYFPKEVPDSQRASPHWAWIALLYPLARANYLLGFPVPPIFVPKLVIAVDLLHIIVCLGIATWNYRRANAIGRRRVKWFVYSAYAGLAPLLFGAGLTVFGLLPAIHFAQVIEYGALSFTLLPIGLLIGIVRYNLFDIDRLITTTASYSAAVAVVAGIAVVVVPRGGALMFAITGMDQQLSQVLLVITLAAVIVPLNRRLRTQIEQAIFPQRIARSQGIEQLLSDIGLCNSPGEVLGLVEARLTSIFGSASSLFTRSQGRFSNRNAAASQPGFDANGELVGYLERNPLPLSLLDQHRTREILTLPESERARLTELEAAVLVPVRSGRRVAAFFVLGTQRSEDMYTATDLAQLGTVAVRASGELRRLEDADTLAAERSRGIELGQQKTDAEVANRAKSRFLAAASHDLRQPMHALGFFVEGLAARVDDDESQRLVDQMRESTGALSQMLDGLLDMSKLEAGAVEPSVTTFSLDELIGRLVGEFEAQARDKGLALRWLRSHSIVRSDPLLLSRILQNLISNAIRHTQQGEVVITARHRTTEIEIEIADTGPGIPIERQQEIFQEFVQLDAEPSEGLGLGLALVERLTRLLGHDLQLDSEPGRGSVFRLRVPAAESRPSPAGSDTVERRAASGLEGRLVVLVDDDLSILEALRGTLRLWGCDVVVGKSVEDALDGLLNLARTPDAIMADYCLGNGQTGIQAIGAIRANTGAEIPAVVVTGETTAGVLEEIASKNLPHLVKPVRPHQLRAVLVELLRT